MSGHNEHCWCGLRLNHDGPHNVTATHRDLWLQLQGAIERSGLDLTCCRMCGEMVVAIPDGLPMCEPCATKEAMGQ